MDTFLVRTLLVPSTVVLLCRLNWWPSQLHIDEDAASAFKDARPSDAQPAVSGEPH
jgi:RND superfamily putative drug exporter